MDIPVFHVDAFTAKPFAGNPAAVCPLEAWPEDAILQAVAAENCLPETAFYTITQTGEYHLRWFTPARELPLSGHATLAAAHILFAELGPDTTRIDFTTQSGSLSVDREGSGYAMDFPAMPTQHFPLEPQLTTALGHRPTEQRSGHYDIAVYDTPGDLERMVPIFPAVAALNKGSIIVTAPGQDCDFVSRFFSPGLGNDEDPVTGTAHCLLAPFWAERLGKTTLRARQLSRRGGEVLCRIVGDRVILSGDAVTVMTGTLHF
ncbi:MAG: PhzF family phenazine biosynthesis protein [Magnetospiraceae bacterium]